jgi:DNA-binding MarR family transcriptional regulator
LVTITPAGAKAVDDLFPRQLSAEVRLLAGLGEDREQVLSALGRLVEAMEGQIGRG